MNYFLIYLILFLPVSIFSQNWQLINPAYTFHYSSDSDSIPDYSLKVDSFEVSGSDTIFYFNKTITDYNQSSIFINEPNLLDYYCLKTDSNYFFYPWKNFILYINKPFNEEWTYDSIHGITAHISGNYEGFILGISDSVRIIRLSSGDSLVISKKFGITTFYDIESGKYYRLIGIQENNKDYGVVPPDFFDIYNYDTGDIFCYETESSCYCGEIPTSNYSKWKVEIIDKEVNGDTIKYKRKYMGFSWAGWSGFPYGDTNYYNSFDEISYINKESDPSNLLKNEIYSDNEAGLYGIVEISKDPFDQRYIKQIGSDNRDNSGHSRVLLNFNTDSLKAGHPVLVSSIFLGEYLECYKEGFGNILHSIQIGEVVEYERLTAYKKGKTIFGNIPEDWEYTQIKENNELSEFSVYPTIFNTYLILNARRQVHGKLNIYNALGEVVIDKQIHLSGTKMLDLADLKRGIYYLKVVDKSGFIFLKTIIKQ